VEVLGLDCDHIKTTKEYSNQRKLSVVDANNLLRSRYLAYAEST
jgi:hypothetical protein